MKKATRFISLILACAMALCVFTACGSEKASTNTSAAYVANLGANSSIKEDSDLTALAKEQVASIIAAKKNGESVYLDSLQEALKGKGYEVYGFAYETEYGSLLYWFSDMEAMDACGEITTGVLAEHIADMTSYGTASGSLTDDKNFTITCFAK